MQYEITTNAEQAEVSYCFLGSDTVSSGSSRWDLDTMITINRCQTQLFTIRKPSYSYMFRLV